MTVEIPSPQPSFTIILLVATPTEALSLPSMVTIAPGQTFTQVQVTAVVDSGNASITAILGADSDTVDVVIGTPDTCLPAVMGAVNAANAYVLKVEAVEPACRVQGKACNKAIAAANTALKALSAANKEVGLSCRE